MASPNTSYGSKIAIGKESTFGTSVSTTLTIPCVSIDLDESPTTVYPALMDTEAEESEAIIVSSRGDGSISLPAAYMNAGLGMLLEAALGSIATTGAGPYTHTATTDKDLPSYTIEAVRGDSGNSQVFTGMRCNTFELSADAQGLGELSVAWLGKGSGARGSTGTIPALAGAPYRVLGAHGGTLSFNSVTYKIKSARFRVNNKLKEIAEYGDTEPGDVMIDGMREISLEVTFFERADTLHAAFQAGTQAALSLAFTSSPRSLTISGSTVRCVSYRAPLDGKGPIEATATFRFLASTSGGTRAVSVALVNSNSGYGAS